MNFKLRSALLSTAMASALFISPMQAAPAPNSAEEVCPLKIGANLPDISLTGMDGKPVNALEALKQGPAILVFYRGGWCPYCNSQLSQLGQVEPKLKAMGYRIWAVSPDTPAELNKTVQKNKLGYTLLSDSKMEAAQALGIAFRVDDATFKKYQGYGIDLEKSSGQPHHLLPVPAVYVLDTTGKVHFSYVNPDYKVRLNGDVLLAAAKAALPTK